LLAELRDGRARQGISRPEADREEAMTSIERREGDNGQLRYVARDRDPSGRQRNKTFKRKIDAERYLTSIENAKLTGQYVDPARSRVTVGAWADLWIDAQADSPHHPEPIRGHYCPPHPAALGERRLAVNAAAGVSLPPVRQPEKRF
jgi:hypothetical protein